MCATRESNTVTRFKVSSDRQLVEEDRVSFANLGLTNNASVNDAYVSDTSAFIMSKESWSLIEWNPTTMEITGKEVSIGFAKKDGIDGFINDAVEVGGQIMAPVFWQDSEQYLMYPGTGVILIDPKNSSEPNFIEDPRIASGWKISGSDNGDAYVLGQVFAEFRRFGGAFGGGEIPASGVLRIRKGEQKFDPDFKVDLDEITQSSRRRTLVHPSLRKQRSRRRRPRCRGLLGHRRRLRRSVPSPQRRPLVCLARSLSVCRRA